MAKTYRVVRMYFNKPTQPKKVLKRGLTLEEAQKHCKNRETSSSTSSHAATRRAHKQGRMWFDGYEEEK